jgi:hypothetical protein
MTTMAKDPRIADLKARLGLDFHIADFQSVGDDDYALAWSTLASDDWNCGCRGPRWDGHTINPRNPCESVVRAKRAVDVILSIYGLDRDGSPKVLA